MAITHPSIIGRGAQSYKVKVNDITVINGWNPRTDFTGHDDLVSYVMENGPSFPPLTVQKIGDQICLRDGERRLRATQAAILAGAEIEHIECIFLGPKTSETESYLMAISGNSGKNLTPVEEAGAFRRLKKWGLSVFDISKRIGKSEQHVYRRLRLVDASPELAAEIAAKNITLEDAEQIIEDSNGSVERQSVKIQKKKTERVGKLTIKFDFKEDEFIQVRKDLEDTDPVKRIANFLSDSLGLTTSVFYTDLEHAGFDPKSFKIEIKAEKPEGE